MVARPMKPDYGRIPRHTLKTLQAWIATGRHLDESVKKLSIRRFHRRV
jgi:hypothetical protein